MESARRAVKESVSRKTYEDRAPWLPLEELDDILFHGAFDVELPEEPVDEVWVFGSFANPDGEIDSGDHYSDLDVFAVVDEWALPLAESGLAAQAGEGPRWMRQNALNRFFRWRGEREWKKTAREAFADLPSWAQESLRGALGSGVIVSEADEEANVQRPLDLFIGDRDDFERWTDPGARFELHDREEEEELSA